MSRIQLVIGAPVALAVSRLRFAKLRRARPRPYAIAGLPPVMPPILISEGWGPGLIDIVLGYGFPFPVSEPLIEVATCFAAPDCFVPSLEEAIAGAAHRDDCYARDEWEGTGGSFGSPAETPPSTMQIDRHERRAMIDDEERVLAAASYQQYTALQFGQGPTVVTAVARLGFPENLSFGQIYDLEPYFAGYTRFVRSWLKPRG